MPTPKRRKPRIAIEPTGADKRPFIFLVKWPGNHWKNSQWFTFDEALVAAGVKDIRSLPSASRLYRTFASGGDVSGCAPMLVGDRAPESLIPNTSRTIPWMGRAQEYFIES